MTCPCCGACHLDGPRACVREVRAELDRLRAELDRLRRLPVIATCGECRWCHATEVCMHPRAHREDEIDGCGMPPPEWCPLRGGR